MGKKKWNSEAKWIQKEKEKYLNKLSDIPKPKKQDNVSMGGDLIIDTTKNSDALIDNLNKHLMEAAAKLPPIKLTQVGIDWAVIKPNENFQMQENGLLAEKIAILDKLLAALGFPEKMMYPNEKHYLACLTNLSPQTIELRIFELSKETLGLEFFIVSCPKKLSTHLNSCDCFEQASYIQTGARNFWKDDTGWKTAIPGNQNQKVNFSQFIGFTKTYSAKSSNGFHIDMIEINYMILSEELFGFCYVGRVVGKNGDKIYVRWKDDRPTVILTVHDIRVLTTGQDPLHLGPGRYKRFETTSPDGWKTTKYQRVSGHLVQDEDGPVEPEPAFSADPFVGRIVDLGLKED